jgi:NADH-quinone oxidoreductase subunit E
MDSNYGKFETVCRILEENSYDKPKLISILQAVQEKYRYSSKEILTFMALSLNIFPASVCWVATFFLRILL